MPTRPTVPRLQPYAPRCQAGTQADDAEVLYEATTHILKGSADMQKATEALSKVSPQ